MVKHKRVESDEYEYGARGLLQIGDLFRVSGGPTYKSETGDTVPMYDRGVMVFEKYVKFGRGSAWIEAHMKDGGGHVVLWVAKPKKSKHLDRLTVRPYKVHKLREQPVKSKRKRPRG